MTVSGISRFKCILYKLTDFKTSRQQEIKILPQKPGKHVGFTLIELLIVIAIIAVLLTLLAPALHRARTQTRETLCKNNLRQIVMSAIYYANDNKGKFYKKQANGTPWPFIWWATSFPPDTDGRVFFDGYLDGFILQQPGVWTQGIDFAPKVLYCPVVNASDTPYFGFGKMWPTNQGGSWRPFQGSYAYFNPGDIKNSGIWRSNFETPTRLSDHSDLPLFGDIIEIYGNTTDIFQPSNFFRQANHFKSGFREQVYASEDMPKGMNIAHVDGSVIWYDYENCEVYWSNPGNGVQNVWGRP